MAIATTVTRQFDNGQSLEVIGNLALSGNYASGGVAIPWTGVNIKSTQLPVFVHVQGNGGYFYEYVVATAKLITRECAASATLAPEIAATTYPVGVSGDTITYRAVFPKNV